jgi:hypothetical protein
MRKLLQYCLKIRSCQVPFSEFTMECRSNFSISQKRACYLARSVCMTANGLAAHFGKIEFNKVRGVEIDHDQKSLSLRASETI